MEFLALHEEKPGDKWQRRFAGLWPRYRGWYLGEGLEARPSLAQCRAAIATHMPELLPTYDTLCDLAAPDEVAARALSLYRAPPVITGCSVAVAPGREPLLVRNYDFTPDFFEGTIWRGRWSGRHEVIATSEGLFGALDGVNDAGLAAALTFGGRIAHGDGFATPMLVRYILECCATASEAVAALTRIPISMVANIMVLDRNGDHAVAYLSPDRAPIVSDRPVTTNHQTRLEWPESDRWSETAERAERLETLRGDPGIGPDDFIAAFHRKPLFRTDYAGGLGTFYTAALRTADGSVTYHWPGRPPLSQSFRSFHEGFHTAILPGLASDTTA